LLPGIPSIDHNQDNNPTYGIRKARTERNALSYVLLVTYILSIVMLMLTFAYLVSLGGLPLGNFLKLQVNPYFFVLLLLVELPFTSLLAVVIFIILCYAIFFAALGTGFNSTISPIDSSNGFFSMMAPVLLIVSIIITAAEESLGIPILGQQPLVTNTYSGFVGLIYAPFAEELGFRILPLGILTFIPFIAHIRHPPNANADHAKYILPPIKTFFLYLVSPGYYRSRYGGRNRGVDLVLILVTSGIFAYAHVYYGAWSWGKLFPIFVDGIILAVGYLKFGLYVDIPLHWFINDFAGLEIADPLTLGFLILVLIWCMVACVIGIIYSIPSVKRFFRSKKYASTIR
jgi:membrane protease YdiL (CAAX protease family)